MRNIPCPNSRCPHLKDCATQWCELLDLAVDVVCNPQEEPTLAKCIIQHRLSNKACSLRVPVDVILHARGIAQACGFSLHDQGWDVMVYSGHLLCWRGLDEVIISDNDDHLPIVTLTREGAELLHASVSICLGESYAPAQMAEAALAQWETLYWHRTIRGGEDNIRFHVIRSQQ